MLWEPARLTGLPLCGASEKGVLIKYDWFYVFGRFRP